MLALGLIGGCGKPSKGKDGGKQSGSKKEEPPESRRINSGPGNMTRSSETNRGTKLWHIEWQSVQLALSDDQAMGGSMKTVTGIMYKDGADASTFDAEGADADKETNTLKLWGKVTVRSKEHQATLTCEKLTWHADRGVLEASGVVTVVYKDYTLGPFERLLCSPELQYVSTPDLFKEPK
ncbi:MAG: LPS export ABC transporter periplasmic protein LptC [Fimbriimonadaceae bacterium]|nr:LPS export ABC transporter periplasmic protein LptC [Fimbriimonadaceae bacterium]